MTNTKSFTAVADGPEIVAKPGQTVAFTIAGTFVATLVLEQFVNGAWTTLRTDTTPTIGPYNLVVDGQGNARSQRLRFRATAYTSGTAVTTLSALTATTAAGAHVVAPVYQARATLTNAQVKALPTTPVAIVAAPGAGRILVAAACVGDGDVLLQMREGTAYTNVDGGATFKARVGTAGPYATYEVGSFLTYSASWGDTAYQLGGSNNDGAGSAFESWADFANTPIYLSMVNGALGALTGGSADGTLTVTLTYRVFNLVTGLFE